MEERTIKELLQIMLNNIDMLQTGLCFLNTTLLYEGLINDNEYNIISRYLKQDKEHGKKVFFWFTCHEKQPRIEWLEQQIKNL